MSRAQPAQGMNRPAQQPAASRPTPATPGPRPAAGTGPGIAAGSTPGWTGIPSGNIYQRPTPGQLSNFLNLPPQSQAGARSSPPRPSQLPSGSPPRPSQLPSGSPPVASQLPSGPNIKSKTFTTPGGSTITIGGGGGSGTTQGGTTVGGAVGGVKIEGSGGNTYVKGSGAVGAKKGDSAAIAGGSRKGLETASGGKAVSGSGVRAATDGSKTAVKAGQGFAAKDAAGNAVGKVQGGYADSSGYRQGGSLTAARNQWGYTAVNVKGGYGAYGTGRVGSITGIKGPGGNVVTTGRGGAFVNGQFVGGKSWAAVNGAYTRWNCFTPGWFGRYPGAWWPGKWALATTAWATATWAMAGGYCGCSGDGAYYDYGGNVTYEDGTVYYGDQAVASAEQYYDQANQIADSGQEAQNEEWLPLGVFAVVTEPTQKETDKVVQLALNKEGLIRGNLQDFVTDKVIPVTGAVDKKTQRAALKLEGNDSVVVETSLYNLTNDEVPILVHFDSERQEGRTLIRLKPPEEQEQKE